MAEGVDWLALWYRAEVANLGIYLICDNPHLAKSNLYNARNASGDPLLKSLTIRTSPRNPTAEIWIVKKNVIEGGVRRLGRPTKIRDKEERAPDKDVPIP